MKVLESQTKPKQSGLPDPLNKLVSSLKLGGESAKDVKAQDIVIAALDKILDNRFTLLRNITLEGLDVPIPLILVSPAGVRVMYVSSVHGIFQASGEMWEALDERTQKYKAVKPNLITRTLLMARAVDAYLKVRSDDFPAVEPDLFLPDPGAHVEANRPAVRIVKRDGIDHFAAGLMQSSAMYGKEKAQSIIKVILDPHHSPKGIAGEILEEEALPIAEETAERPPAVRKPPSRDQLIARKLSKAPFSNTQLLVLGCLVLANICLVIGFVVAILVLS